MSVFAAAPGPIYEYCRLCASREPPDRLLSFASNERDSNALLTAIRCLNTTIARKDGLPQNICCQCDTILKATTNFLQKVKYTQDLLSRLFSASKSESVKLENVGPTNHTASEDLNNIRSLSSPNSSKQLPVNVHAMINSCHSVAVPCQQGESSIKQCTIQLPSPLVKSFSQGAKFNLTIDTFNSVECSGTSTVKKDQFYEMKKENVEVIISGRKFDGVALKKLKSEIKNDSDSSQEAQSSHDSSEESGMNTHVPFPEFAELKNENTDAIAKSNDTDGNRIKESQSSAMQTQFSEVILKDEAPKANDEVIEASATVAEQITRRITRGKTIARRASKKSDMKAVSRKSRNISKGKAKMSALNNSSTLPLYNGFPTAIEDQPTEVEDSTIERWSNHYFCKRCNVHFDTLQKLRQHWWDTHKRCIAFKCNTCTIVRLTYKTFFRHLIKHHKSLEKCCEFCNKCFISAADTRYHKKLDHPEENRPHRCGSCGSGFESAMQLREHSDDYIVVRAKKVGDRRFKCEVCGQEFLNKITLVTHMDNHDATKNVCQFCNKSCTNNNTLKAHIFMVHEGKLQVYCQICGKGFKRKSQLRAHLDAHDGVKRFSCDICHKKFRNESQRKSHQQAHSSVKPYVCEVCDNSYKFKCGLKNHVRTHQEDYVPYACDVCVKTFQSWSNYNKHMKRIHGKDMSKRKNMLTLSTQFLT